MSILVLTNGVALLALMDILLSGISSPPQLDLFIYLLKGLLLLLILVGLVYSGWRHQMTIKRRAGDLERLKGQMWIQSQVIDSLSDAMIATDLQGRILIWNRGAENLYGYTANEALGMRFAELDPASSGQNPVNSEIEQHDGEETRLRRDGSPISVRTHISVIRDLQGQPIALKHVESSIMTSPEAVKQPDPEQIWLKMVENMHLPAVIINQLGQITFCNDYAAILFEAPKEEILGTFWNRFIPKEMLEGSQKIFQRILAGSETCIYTEWPIRTQRGKQIILALNIIPLRNRHGEINAVAGLGADITEQTQVEQDRERRMQEMATLQEAGRFTTSIPHLDQALTGIVSAARLLLGSQTAMILLHDGASHELVVAAFDGNLTLNSNLPPKSYIRSRGDRMPEMAGVAGWVLRQRQPVLIADLSKEIDFEIVSDTSLRSFMAVPMIYQNRVIGVFEVNNSTQRAFNKQDLPLISMLADFATMAVINTQLFDSELEQRRLLEESQACLIQSEKMNAMGRLIAILAHEINNPLQSLRSGISLLREQPLNEQKKQSYLEMIYLEVERLNRTVNQVLGFYRRPGQEPSPVSLNQMLAETLNLIEKQLEQNRITVRCDFDPHLPLITGLPDQLHQVFLNLILNAVDAMPDGGQLTLKTDRDDATGIVRAAIQDNGVGIASTDLQKIFEPFYTTHPDGSGLGLWISYHLIEKHQGSLIVSSLPQTGTTFTVTLPIQPGFPSSE